MVSQPSQTQSPNQAQGWLNKGILCIEEDEDLALVAVVGENMVKQSCAPARVLSVLGDANINIKVIDQGIDEYSIILGISNSDFNKAIKVLYEKFAHAKMNE